MSPDEIFALLSDGKDRPLAEVIGDIPAALSREYIPSGMVTEDDLTSLANVVAKLRPVSTLEIGLASASTTITIIGSKRGRGHHTAFDPCQTSQYNDLGVGRLAKADFSDQITLIQKPSYLGLPALLPDRASSFDFAFVDGNHMFDHTLLEWFYIDKLLKVGGVVGFDDVIWPMVHAVLNFVEANCRYKIWKPNDRTWFLIKLTEDNRHWFEFKPFVIPWGNHYAGMIDRVRADSGL